jgi:hypothetical protein
MSYFLALTAAPKALRCLLAVDGVFWCRYKWSQAGEAAVKRSGVMGDQAGGVMEEYDAELLNP